MAAPTFSWNAITSAQTDAESPIDTTLMEGVRQNLMHLKEWLGDSFTPAVDHDHDGITGQVVTILSEHAITITDGTNIFLSGSANFVMASSDTLTLICKADGNWYELGRSDNT